MLWLAAHMWLLLFASFGIGVGVGWWIWGARGKSALPPSQEPLMGTLDSEFQEPPENATHKD